MKDPISNPYVAEHGFIVGRNRSFYNNRPLYGDHCPSYVIAGDRPQLRFARSPNIYGCMMLAVKRNLTSKWLHDAVDVTSRYRAGRIEWEIRDPVFEGMTVRWEAIPLPGTEGFTVKVSSTGAQSGDSLIWTFGGAMPFDNVSGKFDPVVTVNQPGNKAGGLVPVLQRCFQPEDCRENQIRLAAHHLHLGESLQPDTEGSSLPVVESCEETEDSRFILTTSGTVRLVIGRCTAGQMRLSDASAWTDPGALTATTTDLLPLVCGNIDLSAVSEVCWAIEAVEGELVGRHESDDPTAAFARARERVEAYATRIVLNTPEPRLDAGVAAACYAMDSLFYPPVYVHGAMAWNIPFPGWRSMYGATAFGWHENVKAEARYYIASQNRETTARVPEASDFRRLCTQTRESRFHGRGRIVQDAGPYNFQTQFFDQLIHAWRWTGDKELEDLLREALPLHMEWVQECFDPDNDGLYESYINTWPSDSVWCNGGGSAEETAYAFAGYMALAELARRSGNDAVAEQHEAQAARIRKAMLDVLWIKNKGYMAQYKEQGGLSRVHEDSWLGAIFLPIETGVLDSTRAAEALHYTEWGLERVVMPFGGSRCWMSNWVPAPWSVREMYPGDNYALSLAYFRAGLAGDGWDILQGNYLESMYYGVVPGGLACANGGTDFADVVSTFCRTVVEGLFGYHPDYLTGVVHFAPQFPPSWDHASIKTPDAGINFQSGVDFQVWTVDLTKPARLRLDLPVRAKKISGVEVNGTAAEWSVAPGFGCSIVHVDVDSCVNARVIVKLVPASSCCAVEKSARVEAGRCIRLEVDDGLISEFLDPQGVLNRAVVVNGYIAAHIAVNPGHHLLQAKVLVGDLPQWRMFKIRIDDPQAELAKEAMYISHIDPDATWECCDISRYLNGDVRTIYKQDYLLPRPKSCSVSIGKDGYSPWTFAYWKTPVPEVDLSLVPALIDDYGLLQTQQGVPFAWNNDALNIAFVSLWENWPREAVVQVGQCGAVVWFLLCGTTNPMQCRIANARLRMTYIDGFVEDLDVVPPMNFWTLCPLGGADYNYSRDGFALPARPPPTVQLGNNCRAVLMNARLRHGVVLRQVTLEALSQEIVMGLMGVTIMR
ncbi:MAG: DUF4450 domain-containing protein [bacterium]